MPIDSQGVIKMPMENIGVNQIPIDSKGKIN